MFVQGTKELISAHFINHGTVATNARKKKIIKICKKSTEIKNPEDRYNADPEKKKEKRNKPKKRNKVQILSARGRLKRQNNMRMQSQRNRLEKPNTMKISNLRNRQKKNIVKTLNPRKKQ